MIRVEGVLTLICLSDWHEEEKGVFAVSHCAE